jgi:hypothetical protein
VFTGSKSEAWRGRLAVMVVLGGPRCQQRVRDRSVPSGGLALEESTVLERRGNIHVG